MQTLLQGTRKCWCWRWVVFRCWRWRRWKENSCFFGPDYSFPVHRCAGGLQRATTARKAHHTNVVEQAIYFFRSSAGCEAVLEQLIYKGHGGINAPPVVDKCDEKYHSHATKWEGPYWGEGWTGRNLAVYPMQEIVAWMKDFVSKLPQGLHAGTDSMYWNLCNCQGFHAAYRSATVL